MLEPSKLKEAVLWEPLAGGSVRCDVCQVRCVIPPGKRGVCTARANEGGRLYSLIHGQASIASLDPIEKKPLFHFFPGRAFLSAGTRGCNLRCPGCQNWQVAHDSPADDGSNLEPFSPLSSVELAQARGARGLAWTYNEPIVWIEHVLEASLAARARGLATALITNGFATPEALALVAPSLDAYRLDVKAFSKKAFREVSGGFVRFERILDVAVLAKEKHGLHVECVTNVTPGINDSERDLRETARWIASALGPLTPWHVTRFFPHKDLIHLRPTPVAAVERAREWGLEAGLRHVYVGNLPGHEAQDTRCHACGEVLVARRAFAVTGGSLRDGRCGRCSEPLPGRFDPGPIVPTDGRRFRVS